MHQQLFCPPGCLCLLVALSRCARSTVCLGLDAATTFATHLRWCLSLLLAPVVRLLVVSIFLSILACLVAMVVVVAAAASAALFKYLVILPLMLVHVWRWWCHQSSSRSRPWRLPRRRTRSRRRSFQRRRRRLTEKKSTSVRELYSETRHSLTR